MALRVWRIKAFFFDLDGTIWDSEAAIVDSLRAAIIENSSEVVSKQTLLLELKRHYSPSRVLSLHGVIEMSSYWRNYNRNLRRIGLFFDSTADVFEYLLKCGKLIGYVTSLKKKYVTTLLERFELDKYHSTLITPSECKAMKPSPRPIIMALEQTSTSRSDAIYIGDQDSDIIAARRAGCKSGLACWGGRILSTERPDYAFHRIEDVLTLI